MATAETSTNKHDPNTAADVIAKAQSGRLARERRRAIRERDAARLREAEQKRQRVEKQWEASWGHAAEIAQATEMPLPLIDDSLEVLRARTHLGELYREAEGHADDACRRAKWWARMFGFLSAATTLLAAIAAITVLADTYPWITGVSAGLAALISGLQTTFNPRSKSDQARAENIDWDELAYDIRFWLIFRIGQEPQEEVAKSYKEFVRRSFVLSRRYALAAETGTPEGQATA